MENFPKPRFEPWQDLDYNGIFFHSMTTFRNFCAKLVQLRTCSVHVAHKPHAPWLHFTGSPPDSRRTWLFSDTASIVQNECYPRGAFLTILSIFFFRPYAFGHPPPLPAFDFAALSTQSVRVARLLYSRSTQPCLSQSGRSR